MPRVEFLRHKENTDEIRVHQAVHLVKMVPFMVFGNLLCMAASILNAPHVFLNHYVYLPYAIITLLMLPMLMNWRKYADAPAPQRVSRGRVRRASIHALLLGLTWATACIMTFPHLNAQEQSMFVGIMGVMMVGGGSALSRMPSSGVSFGLPLGIVLLVCGVVFDRTPNRVVTFGVVMGIIAYAQVLRFNWLAFVEHVRTDVSRRALQDRLNAQEAIASAQRGLMEALPFPLVVTRGEMALFASPSAMRVFGLKPQDLNNPDISNRRYFARDEDFRYLAGCQLRNEAVPEMQVLFNGADGNTFWALVSCKPIKFGGGDAWINAIMPMEERMKVERELAKAKEQAELASNAKTDFLASMSHELRTPLNAIIGYSEILLEEAEEEGNKIYADDLGKIRTAGRHILALINDILDITKIEAGKMEVTPEHVTLPDLMGDVGAVIRRLMEKNGNQFIMENDATVQTLWTDVTKARQTIINLLSNAAKFTRDGSVVIRVTSEQRDGADWLRFTVTDTGIGIPEDQIDNIFDEFNQGDSNTARHFGGTGLGLALSRKIARLLGGDITARSKVGEGSVFEFTMPARLAEVEAA